MLQGLLEYFKSTLRNDVTGEYSSSRFVMVFGFIGFTVVMAFVLTLIALTWAMHGPQSLVHLSWLTNLVYGGAGSGLTSAAGYCFSQWSNKDSGIIELPEGEYDRPEGPDEDNLPNRYPIN